MRGCRLQTGETTMTLEIWIGAGRSMTPPGIIWVAPIRLGSFIGRGFRCRLIVFRFSTTTLPSRGSAASTRPCLPRSLPLSTWTTSPLRIFSFVFDMVSAHLGRSCHDPHEVAVTQLAGDGAEDPRAPWVALGIDDH